MKRLDFFGLAFVLASIAFCVVGLSRLQSNTEDVLQWLPDQSVAREQYDFFEEHFGADDFLIVTWDKCTVDDPRLNMFSQHLRDNDSANLIQSVVNGAEIADRLGQDLRLSQKSIVRRMQGVFFGTEDPNQTCVLVELSQAGTADRSASMQLVWNAIQSVPNLNRNDVKLGGYPYIGTFVDGQLKNSFRLFLIPSVLMATLVALICLRNLVLTLIVFVTATGAGLVSIAIVPACGMKFGGLMSIIPALVFVLATSGSIHLIRYSLNVIGNVRQLIAIGWKPCTISAATTAAGMLSLTRSDFPAIRNFGFICAAGVAVALAFQLVMIPWLLNRLGTHGLRKLAARGKESSFWPALMDRIQKRKYLISTLSVSIMILSAIGLTKLIANVEVEKLFSPESEIFVSLVDLEKKLGPMDQTELLVVFEAVKPEDFLDRARLIRQIQASIASLPGIGTTHSLANFLPVEPKKTNLRSFVKWELYRVGMLRERQYLAHGNLLNVDAESETWRISLRFPFTKKNDFEKLSHDVINVCNCTVDKSEFASAPATRPNLVYTGKTHLFHYAQITLLADLFKNVLLAFLIITPMLIIVLRSFSLGLIAMLPNLFPVLIVFGCLGWVGFPIDLAIAMTACIALGIAVDDTTHFLVRFRDFDGSLNQIAATHETGHRSMWTRDASYNFDWRIGTDRLLLQRHAGPIPVFLGNHADVNHRPVG